MQKKTNCETAYELIAQGEHCFAMMKRLKRDITNIELCGTTVVVNHTRMEHDIQHLRRELNELRKMLSCYGWKWEKEK